MHTLTLRHDETMGILVPEDFDLGSLRTTERTVVTALLDGTTDGWHILPDVSFVTDGTHQIDIVIAHAREGIGIVEVKGYCPRIESGSWFNDLGAPIDPPTAQLTRNQFGLRDLLRQVSTELTHLQVTAALAFPRAGSASGELPPDLPTERVIFSDDLADIQDAVDALFNSGYQVPLSDTAFEAIITRLRPDAEFHFDPRSRARNARRRLDEISSAQTRALEGLDVNRRVYVTGGAGTGKTRLAAAWAARAARRGERALFVCFNEPLADQLRDLCPERDNLTVGAFFPTVLHLDGMTPLEIPDDADTRFWSERVVGHIHSHWPEITAAFDTIVVDEAQDFSPAWLAQLAGLLDPDGARRMLMVGDADQDLHWRGFVAPSTDDGWVHCELLYNTRNSFEIARLLRSYLNGPRAPVGGPESHVIDYVEVHDHATAVASALAVVERHLAGGHSTDSIVVATMTSAMRTALRAGTGDVPLVAWEDRDETSVVCETVQRLKGIEADHVVLVHYDYDANADADADVGDDSYIDDTLLYVGVSRAILGLTVIAQRDIGTRLGLVGS